MEIERKYLIDKNKIPFQPSDFPCRRIEQGYLCTEPVVRFAGIRMIISSPTNQKD